MRFHGRLTGVFLAAIGVVSISGCAVNPATGERQLSFISEGQEIQMGFQNDTAVVAQMGLYGGPQLQAYMQQLGSSMAATTERPNLPWTFRVVDDPIVNAFALPGGFIYITRGIMAHFTSEAQLASVLGHEIGHVTGKHSVEQMSRAQLAQVGLIAGVIAAPKLQSLFGAAGAGLQVLFLKFGRGDESQADELGLRYLIRGQYDPRPMPEVYAMLASVTQAAGGSSTPEWLSTHPDPENREARIESLIAATGQNFDGRKIGTGEYLDRLEGLVFGEDPREGYFEDNVFYHPDLRFRITFPAGWRTLNTKQAVMAANEQGDAVMQLTLAQGQATPDAAAQAFFAQDGITGSPRRTRVNNLTAVSGNFTATTDQGQVNGAALFIQHGRSVYQLLGYGGNTWNQNVRAVQSSMGTFGRLTDQSKLNVKPNRLEIVTLDRDMTLRQFTQRYPSVVSEERIALINQINAQTALRRGTKIKRVVN